MFPSTSFPPLSTRSVCQTPPCHAAVAKQRSFPRCFLRVKERLLHNPLGGVARVDEDSSTERNLNLFYLCITHKAEGCTSERLRRAHACVSDLPPVQLILGWVHLSKVGAASIHPRQHCRLPTCGKALPGLSPESWNTPPFFSTFRLVHLLFS